MGGMGGGGGELRFFVTFNIITSHIFPENLIEIPQVVHKTFSVNVSYFDKFSSIF